MSELLDKLNNFTRREHTEDEVYIFDLILCDNDIDRDYECFSMESLNKLKELFIGKTGIFDHNAKGSNQTARIFDTELITDNNRTTKYGTAYTYLKACAYMIRTDSNSDLIREIDGGIKKEVSISCSCAKNICSICGADKNKKKCAHVKGKEYSGKLCYVILDEVTDAYEWSFVAVPAQVNAGVTKRFNSHTFNNDEAEMLKIQIKKKDEIIDLITQNLKADITKLCFMANSGKLSTILSTAVEKMDVEEIFSLKKSLEENYVSATKPQLDIKSGKNSDDNKASEFKL